MELFSEKLKQLLFSRGISANALAVGCDIPASTISRLLNGIADKPRSATLAKIAEFLGTSPSELIQGTQLAGRYSAAKGKTLKGVKVPLVSSEDIEFAAIEGDVTPHETFLPPFPFEGLADKELVATEMQSEALAPRIAAGDQLYIEKVFELATEPEDGQIVLAAVKNQEDKPAIVRLFQKDDLGNSWLVATNPNWPCEKILPCGRVTGIVVGFAAKL